MPGLNGSPCSTPTCAPLGRSGGAGPHCTSFALIVTASTLSPAIDLSDILLSANASGAIASTATAHLVFHIVIPASSRGVWGTSIDASSERRAVSPVYDPPCDARPPARGRMAGVRARRVLRGTRALGTGVA